MTIRRKPLTATSAARILAWRVLEYVGTPDGRGGYTYPADEFLDADRELYAMARETLRLLPRARRPRRRG